MKKVALITGASSGIGRDLAHIHAELKGDLILVARSVQALNELKAELEEKHGVEVLCIPADLTQDEAPLAIFDQVTQAEIEVDYLINNAGFGALGEFWNIHYKTNLDMIRVNDIAITALTYLFLPGMIKRNRGRILITSSTAALMPGPLQAVYYATKAYATSFGNALAEELSETRITVTTLMPGATDTGFGARSGMDKTPLFAETAPSREVAEAGYRAMVQGKLEILAGLPLSLRLTMKLAPIIPKKMLLKQIKKAQQVTK